MQMPLWPVIVEELILEDHSVEGTAGRPALDPQLLVSLRA
jgi:hypothetical protein